MPSMAQASSLAAFRAGVRGESHAARPREATVQETMQAINETCRARGGPFAEYSCQTVSWDDVCRGTTGGGLSCWGANITDTRLWAKDGRPLFTVRSDNWNEKLGKLPSSELAVIVGNHLPANAERNPVTLKALLDQFGEFGKYAGLDPSLKLASPQDSEVSVRYQVCFLPVGDDARATLEFATEAYNYQTRSDADPRNLVVLCTSQGLAVQADGQGAKKLFHHGVDEKGRVHRHWLEAERSEHKVGGEQRESAEEKADALARGKATSSVIGPRALGTRFNCLMTLQIPLKQKQDIVFRSLALGKKGTKGAFGGPSFGFGALFGGFAAPMAKMAVALPADWDESSDDECFACVDECPPPMAPMMACASMAPPQLCESLDSFDGLMEQSMALSAEAATFSKSAKRSCRRGSPRAAPPKGTANAARVSVGSEVDVWPGLKCKPERLHEEHVTATVVLYYTVQGGVPTEADVCAAVQDLEQLYAASGCGRLAEPAFDFMKAPLDAETIHGIQTKLTEQPYAPAPAAVTGGDAFPQ